MAFRDDMAMSVAYMPHIKEIIGRHLLVKDASPEDDRRRNTDLIVMQAGCLRIACRVRRTKFLERCACEFTIRRTRPCGVPTEYHKILGGWGDYFLYGFAEPGDNRLAEWTLADLAVYRNSPAAIAAAQSKVNGDGPAFLVHMWADFPPDLVIATSLHPLYLGRSQ